MTTPTQNPSSVSQTLAAVICILQNLNPDTYTHTSTLLAAFKAQGIQRDLRSIQRYLVALADYSLVEHDNHHPKGRTDWHMIKGFVRRHLDSLD